MSLNLSAAECTVVLLNRQRLLSSDRKDRVAVLDRVVSALQIPFFAVETESIDAAIYTEMMRRIKTENGLRTTPNLIIGGAYLENEVTLSVLHGLAEGFDVYCLSDLILPLENEFTYTFNARLIQAGAVPSTLRQVLYQWSMSEADPLRRATLTELFEGINGA